jgi:hypothetical protein
MRTLSEFLKNKGIIKQNIDTDLSKEQIMCLDKVLREYYSNFNHHFIFVMMFLYGGHFLCISNLRKMRHLNNQRLKSLGSEVQKAFLQAFDCLISVSVPLFHIGFCYME